MLENYSENTQMLSEGEGDHWSVVVRFKNSFQDIFVSSHPQMIKGNDENNHKDRG